MCFSGAIVNPKNKSPPFALSLSKGGVRWFDKLTMRGRASPRTENDANRDIAKME
jgi:hypothetical protein